MATHDRVVEDGEIAVTEEVDAAVQRDPGGPDQGGEDPLPSTGGRAASTLSPFDPRGVGTVTDGPPPRVVETTGRIDLNADVTGAALTGSAAAASPPPPVEAKISADITDEFSASAQVSSSPLGPGDGETSGGSASSLPFDLQSAPLPRTRPSIGRQPTPDFVPSPLRQPPQAAAADELPPPRPAVPTEPTPPARAASFTVNAEPAKMTLSAVPAVVTSSARSQSRSGATTVVVDPPRARSEGASDAPTTEDRLGFRPYVEAVAALLRNVATKPPFTMSIEGEWGSGKSSFLAQLADVLTRQQSDSSGRIKSARVVRFSPWRHENDESLWASFALEFVEQTKPKGVVDRLRAKAKLTWRQLDFADNLMPILTAVVALLSWVAFAYLLVEGVFFPQLADEKNPSPIVQWWEYAKTWVPSIIGGSGLLQTLRKLASTATLKLDTKLDRYIRRPDYANKRSFLASFLEDFADYFETHIPPGERVFVLLDDLDRCDPMQAADVLKRINLMIPDKLELFFIMAIDRLKVAAGIAAGQEKVLPFVLADRGGSPEAKVDRGAALSFGYEFLEKFVQLPFRLPRMGIHNASAFVDSLVGKTNATAAAPRPPAILRDVVATDSPMVSKALLEVTPFLGSNPRRMKQFLNLYRLRHYVLESTRKLGAGGPTLTQLAKVVTLEISWPRLIEEILRRPPLLKELEEAAAKSVPTAPGAAPAASAQPGPAPAVGASRAAMWLSDDQLREFLGAGLESDRIGDLDLGAILGAAPSAVELSATQRQTATVHAVVTRGDSSVEQHDLST